MLTLGRPPFPCTTRAVPGISNCRCDAAIAPFMRAHASESRRDHDPVSGPSCRLIVQSRARSGLVQPWTIPWSGRIFFTMYEFTKLEEEPEPQPYGSRFGPPRKGTGAGILDSPQFPPVRPKCFGCSQPLAVAEIGSHILSCDQVSAQDLARFETAQAEFHVNPDRAREVVEGFVNRVRFNSALDAGHQSW